VTYESVGFYFLETFSDFLRNILLAKALCCGRTLRSTKIWNRFFPLIRHEGRGTFSFWISMIVLKDYTVDSLTKKLTSRNAWHSFCCTMTISVRDQKLPTEETWGRVCHGAICIYFHSHHATFQSWWYKEDKNQTVSQESKLRILDSGINFGGRFPNFLTVI